MSRDRCFGSQRKSSAAKIPCSTEGSSPRTHSFSTPAEKFVPKDASLLETEDIGSGDNSICDGEAVGGNVDGCDVDDRAQWVVV